MNLQCGDGFLFHLWGSTGNCLRCGVTGIHLDVAYHDRTPFSETSVDDRSAPASLLPVHPADHPSRFGALLPAFLRRHHRETET